MSDHNMEERKADLRANNMTLIPRNFYIVPKEGMTSELLKRKGLIITTLKARSQGTLSDDLVKSILGIRSVGPNASHYEGGKPIANGLPPVVDAVALSLMGLGFKATFDSKAVLESIQLTKNPISNSITLSHVVPAESISLARQAFVNHLKKKRIAR